MKQSIRSFYAKNTGFEVAKVDKIRQVELKNGKTAYQVFERLRLRAFDMQDSNKRVFITLQPQEAHTVAKAINEMLQKYVSGEEKQSIKNVIPPHFSQDKKRSARLHLESFTYEKKKKDRDGKVRTSTVPFFALQLERLEGENKTQINVPLSGANINYLQDLLTYWSLRLRERWMSREEAKEYERRMEKKARETVPVEEPVGEAEEEMEDEVVEEESYEEDENMAYSPF